MDAPTPTGDQDPRNRPGGPAACQLEMFPPTTLGLVAGIMHELGLIDIDPGGG